jgi:hypothetical protein
MKSLDYNSTKVYLNSGIISHIYTQLCESFNDFHGIFTGRYKITTEKKANDINSSLEIKTLNILIDNVIFINDRNYLKEDLPSLLEKISNKYSQVLGKKLLIILGIMSARSYSHSTLSLRDQQLFLRVYNLLANKSEVPIVYGAFSHNCDKDGLKGLSFTSKLFMLKE